LADFQSPNQPIDSAEGVYFYPERLDIVRQAAARKLRTLGIVLLGPISVFQPSFQERLCLW